MQLKLQRVVPVGEGDPQMTAVDAVTGVNIVTGVAPVHRPGAVGELHGQRRRAEALAALAGQFLAEHVVGAVRAGRHPRRLFQGE